MTATLQSSIYLCLAPSDGKQRMMATAYLLEKMAWTGISEFKAGLTASRTRQLCDTMTVTKDLMANLLRVDDPNEFQVWGTVIHLIRTFEKV